MMIDNSSYQLINGFLQQIGFSETHWHGSPLTLVFEQSGTLHIEITEKGLLLAHLKDINEYEMSDLLPKALRLVHWSQTLPLTVHAGLKGDKQLAFITTLSSQQLSLPNLNEATTVLEFLHQKITE